MLLRLCMSVDKEKAQFSRGVRLTQAYRRGIHAVGNEQHPQWETTSAVSGGTLAHAAECTYSNGSLRPTGNSLSLCILPTAPMGRLLYYSLSPPPARHRQLPWTIFESTTAALALLDYDFLAAGGATANETN